MILRFALGLAALYAIAMFGIYGVIAAVIVAALRLRPRSLITALVNRGQGGY